MSASTAVVPDLRRGRAGTSRSPRSPSPSASGPGTSSRPGVRYTEQMGLSAGQKSLLVAIPVLVGSLGHRDRRPTDRFGGRLMFTVLMLAPAPFVLLVAPVTAGPTG